MRATTTLAVTGATGFVGRALTRAALARGWRVRALARDPQALPPAPGLEAVRWDAANSGGDPAALGDALSGVDAVCHLAAFVPRDHADPDAAARCFAVNALGTLGLLRAAEAAAVPRFVHASSGNAYAPSLSGEPAGEAWPLYPAERAPFYLASKLTAEIYVEHWRRSRGLNACVLRLASVYGPGMAPHGLLPKLAANIATGRPVSLEDGGRYAADFVEVGDVARALLAAATSPVQGPVNVGSGVATAAADLAGLIVGLAGADPGLVEVLPRNAGGASPGFPALDIAKARRGFGFEPTPLDAGLGRYLASSPAAAPPVRVAGSIREAARA